MNKDIILNNIFNFSDAAFDLRLFLLKLTFSFIFSLIITYTYKKYNFNREFKFANYITFPIDGLSIVLIISIIKSSIALSLGLIGALSIVRLRTPIKNSEELIYYFLIIGISIGLGADRIYETIIFFIFVVFSIRILYSLYMEKIKVELESNVVIIECSSENYTKVSDIIDKEFPNNKFLNLNSFENKVYLKYLINSNSSNQIQKLMNLNKLKIINNINIDNLDEITN